MALLGNNIHYYTIQVIAIPVEDCESFRDCTSCTGLGDPLCGWCSIENKCSCRSECSCNNETRRWIQNQTMCIVNFAIPPTGFNCFSHARYVYNCSLKNNYVHCKYGH